MVRIETRELTGELKCDDTVVLTYTISYPEITSLNNFGVAIFNMYNRQKAIDLEKYTKTYLYPESCELYKHNKENGYPIMVYEVNSQFTITYNQNNFISLYIDQYEFRGGAHGSTIRSSQTWNLQTGQILNLSYFYSNNPFFILDILRNINSQIKSQIEQGGAYFDNYTELLLQNFNPENYYLTPYGIVIYFQQYDIAPYSSGIPIFYV